MKLTLELTYPVVENRTGADHELISGEKEACDKQGLGSYVGVLTDWSETEVTLNVEVINDEEQS